MHRVNFIDNVWSVSTKSCYFLGDNPDEKKASHFLQLTLKLVSFCAAFFVAGCTSSGPSTLTSSALMLLIVRWT